MRRDKTTMSREGKVLIYCMGTLKDLSDKGILRSGRLVLSSAGMKQYAELKKEGFRPTDEEMKTALDAIQGKCAEVSSN